MKFNALLYMQLDRFPPLTVVSEVVAAETYAAEYPWRVPGQLPALFRCAQTVVDAAHDVILSAEVAVEGQAHFAALEPALDYHLKRHRGDSGHEAPEDLERICQP